MSVRGGVGYKRKSSAMSGDEQETSGGEAAMGDSGSTQEQLAFEVIMTGLQARLNRYSDFYEKISMNPIGIVYPNEIEHTLTDVLMFLDERIVNHNFHVGIPSLESLSRRTVMEHSLLPDYDKTAYVAVVRQVIGMCMKIFSRMFNFKDAGDVWEVCRKDLPLYHDVSDVAKLARIMVPKPPNGVRADATQYERDELQHLYRMMRDFFMHMPSYENYFHRHRSTYPRTFVNTHFDDDTYVSLAGDLSTYLAGLQHQHLLFSDIQHMFVNIFGRFLENFSNSNPSGVQSRAFQDAAAMFRLHGQFVVFGAYGLQFAQMAKGKNHERFVGFFNCVRDADEFLTRRR